MKYSCKECTSIIYMWTNSVERFMTNLSNKYNDSFSLFLCHYSCVLSWIVGLCDNDTKQEVVWDNNLVIHVNKLDPNGKEKKTEKWW